MNLLNKPQTVSTPVRAIIRT